MAYKFSDRSLALPIVLDEEEQFVLCMIAYFGRSLQEYYVKDFCAWQKMKVYRVKEIAEKLNRNGIISRPYAYWEPYGYVYPIYYFTVAFLLMDRHPEWWEFFKDQQLPQDPSRRFEWSVAKAVYTNAPSQIKNIHQFPEWGQFYDLYFEQHFFDAEFLPAFASLNPDQMESVALRYLEGMLVHESWDEERMAQFV